MGWRYLEKLIMGEERLFLEELVQKNKRVKEIEDEERVFQNNNEKRRGGLSCDTCQSPHTRSKW